MSTPSPSSGIVPTLLDIFKKDRGLLIAVLVLWGGYELMTKYLQNQDLLLRQLVEDVREIKQEVRQAGQKSTDHEVRIGLLEDRLEKRRNR